MDVVGRFACGRDVVSLGGVELNSRVATVQRLDRNRMVCNGVCAAPPLDLSDFVGALRFAFLRAPAGWFGDWHPAPARQFLVVVEGEFEVSVSDGEQRRFSCGSVLLVEDTTGRGHVTRVLGDREASAAVVQIWSTPPWGHS